MSTRRREKPQAASLAAGSRCEKMHHDPLRTRSSHPVHRCANGDASYNIHINNNVNNNMGILITNVYLIFSPDTQGGKKRTNDIGSVRHFGIASDCAAFHHIDAKMHNTTKP